jgi:hypothetical protein
MTKVKGDHLLLYFLKLNSIAFTTFLQASFLPWYFISFFMKRKICTKWEFHCLAHSFLKIFCIQHTFQNHRMKFSLACQIFWGIKTFHPTISAFARPQHILFIVQSLLPIASAAILRCRTDACNNLPFSLLRELTFQRFIFSTGFPLCRPYS